MTDTVVSLELPWHTAKYFQTNYMSESEPLPFSDTAHVLITMKTSWFWWTTATASAVGWLLLAWLSVLLCSEARRKGRQQMSHLRRYLENRIMFVFTSLEGWCFHRQTNEDGAEIIVSLDSDVMPGNRASLNSLLSLTYDRMFIVIYLFSVTLGYVLYCPQCLMHSVTFIAWCIWETA